ncbi:MAG: SDR family NAD(P)-dependent oxidoreductase [Thermodesulfobacteriota bacterium]
MTGAGRGIGRSIALALAEEGAKVVVVSRNESEIDAVAKEIGKLNVESLAIRADVSKEDQVETFVKKTIERFKRIDILFNNAAILGPTGLITQTSAEDWRNAIDINLNGVFLCSRAVLPQMMNQKEGNIINISSAAGRKRWDNTFLSPTGHVVYSVSKFGVKGFTLALAAQVSRFRINVNALSPGWTSSTFDPNPPPEKRPTMRKADDIKKVAVFLASQGPRGLTGMSIDAETWEKIYLPRET